MSNRIDYSKVDPLLGKFPDTVIAKEVGCSVTTISLRRREKGIEKYGRVNVQTPKVKKVELKVEDDDTYGHLIQSSRDTFRRLAQDADLIRQWDERRKELMEELNDKG